MKKLLYLCIGILVASTLLSIILVSSFSINPNGTNSRVTSKVPFLNVTHYKYKNHDYIKFGSSPVHDPDCKFCLSKFD